MTHTLSAMRGTRREGLTERKSQARKNCNSLLLLLVEKDQSWAKKWNEMSGMLAGFRFLRLRLAS